MKKRLIVVGISMDMGGCEKSLCAFLRALDYKKYDVTLLLSREGGALYSEIPESVKVKIIEDYGEMFTLDGTNAREVIKRLYIKKNPLIYLTVAPYWLKMKLSPKKRHLTAMRLWVALMKKMPALEGNFDVAVAYCGDKTLFYTVDKINARAKIAWNHFNFDTPEREEKLYRKYYISCDAVVSVSDMINEGIKARFPEISGKCRVIENILEVERIRALSSDAPTFDDGFSGTRILTVGRIREEKGIDLAIEAIAKLVREGQDLRYYVVGAGREDYTDSLIEKAKSEGIADRFVLIGEKEVPYGYMRDCGIYLQPSRYEGKPIAVDEAMIFARPIVVTNYPSASAQLRGGRFGLICEPDASSIASALRELLTNSITRGTLISELSSREILSAGTEFERLCDRISSRYI